MLFNHGLFSLKNWRFATNSCKGFIVFLIIAEEKKLLKNLCLILSKGISLVALKKEEI